jgi:hypothetical protein
MNHLHCCSTDLHLRKTLPLVGNSKINIKLTLTLLRKISKTGPSLADLEILLQIKDNRSIQK